MAIIRMPALWASRGRIEQHGLEDCARLCGRTPRQAHGLSADLVQLVGYLGNSHGFGHAIADFAALHADQAEGDWQMFTDAIGSGCMKTASG